MSSHTGGTTSRMMSYHITGILDSIRRGETSSADALMNAVYANLRRLASAKMARQQAGHMLQTTAHVHEAWMRLVDSDGCGRFENPAHFFGAAAEALRTLILF